MPSKKEVEHPPLFAVSRFTRLVVFASHVLTDSLPVGVAISDGWSLPV
jgi:hypothetical protein